MNVTIRPVGEIDVASTPALLAEIDGAVSDGATHILFDLSAVDFFDSSAIGALVYAWKQGCAVDIEGELPHIRRVLDFTGVFAIIGGRHDQGV